MKSILISFLFISSVSFGQQVNYVQAGGSTAAYNSPNRIVLSSRSILSDASLDTGQTSFGTDQTEAIQAILNTASKANPITILWDVKVSTSGLRIKSYTTINALFGCGAILRDNVDNSLLSNYNWTANSNNILDSNITINGGIWNGNGWRSGVQKQANNTTANGQITVVNFFGTKNVRLENCIFLNASSWCVAFMTSENIYINNCVIDDGAVGHYNQDGIDFLGYAKKIRILNNYIRNGDDKIVLCPNSTGGTITQTGDIVADHTAYTGVDGDQSDIIIDGNYFEKQGKGFAFYCGGGNYLYDVTVSNTYGFSQSTWLGIFNADILTGYTVKTGKKWPSNIRFINNHIDVYGYVGYGSTGFPMAALECSADDITFQNCTITNHSQNINPFFITSGTTPVEIKSLTFDNYQAIDSVLGEINHQILIRGAATKIGRLSIINTNIDLVNPGNGDRCLLSIEAGLVSNLFMSNIRYSSFKTMFKNAGTVTNLVANNITGSGLNTGGDISFVNTGTISNAVFSNIICKQLTSGTFGNVDSSNIIYY